MNFKKWNNILGWAVFAIAAAVYLMTMERDFSFWDTGEYIVSSSKLGVTHAPGAAFFQLLGAVWSGLAFGDGEMYGILINSLSAICSAFTILFLFWTTTHMARKIVQPQGNEIVLNQNQSMIVLGSGLLAALCFTFSDSFWFSAVEGEVYAMASAFTALLLWLICKWENESEKPRSDKWLLLISLLVGLSTGVHLMAILVVPALCYIYYFKNHEFSWKSFLIANLITLAIFIFVFKFVFSWTMTLFGKLEIFMVNELGMPFNSGTLVALVLLAALFFFALNFTKKRGFVTANTAVLATLFMIIGFSCWLVIPIRANANPHMNLNDPDDAIGLLDYFNREQYGDWPVFYGPLYTAHSDPNGVLMNDDGSYKMEDNGPIYKKNEAKGIYEVVGRRQNYTYSKEHKGLFARMFSPQNIDGYESLMGPAETYQAYDPKTGEQETFYKKPTLWQNVQFFFSYQIGYMYLRYFGWNYVGKQNDFEGHLETTKGNAKTGISFIDDQILGDQSNLPSRFKNNEANNVYFALPLIIGLFGFFLQLNRDFGRNFALISLFLLGGVGIILYTNVKPFEPRERDYAVVSSFYVFAIWIGLGALAIYLFFKEKIKSVNPKTALIISGLTLAVPILMGFQNWDDHDRSEREAAHDLAYNYLTNLDENAILFVYGDNDTYPLWALQELENFRDDVKIVNFTLLGSPWNISQVKRKTYNAAPVPSQMEESDYRMGVNEGILVMSPDLLGQILAYAEQNNPQLAESLRPMMNFAENGMTAKEAMNWILDKKNPAKQALINELKMVFSGGVDNVLPTNKIIVPVNKANALKYGIISKSQEAQMVDNVVFTIKSRQIAYKSELMMLDLLANYNWDRGIYFSSGGMYDDTNIFYLNDYLEYEGFNYKFVPIQTLKNEYGETGTIDPIDMYNQIKNYKWANFDNPNAYFDETSRNNILTYRNAVTRTVDALIKQGDKTKAKEIMDLVEAKIPYERYTEGVSLYSMVPIYYKLGEKEKAEKLKAFLQARLDEEMNYYNALPEGKQNSVYGDKRRLESEKQYFQGIMIEHYLRDEKDTVEAFKMFKTEYQPIVDRIQGIIDKAKRTGINSLTEEEQKQLTEDLSSQRAMLSLAMEIDSLYADQQFQKMMDWMNEIDPTKMPE